jgi:methyltransferase-like protein
MSDQFALTVNDLEYRTAGNDVVVHDPTNERVHVLNATAAYILRACDGKHSAVAIAEDLSARSGVPSAHTLPDVERVLVQFTELQLIG